MLDFSYLLEFSHHHCIAICAALVPANLLATVQTMIRVGFSHSKKQVYQAAGLASLFAVLMVLHVLTWFVVGVVMPPTFILLSLGAVCLTTNMWAVWHPQSMRGLLAGLSRRLGPLRTRTASLS